jgi:hypothetical protein
MSKKKRKGADDLEGWLKEQDGRDPGMEQRVEVLLNEMEIEMGLIRVAAARGRSLPCARRRAAATSARPSAAN